MPVQDTMANPSRLLPDEELGRPLASSRRGGLRVIKAKSLINESVVSKDGWLRT